MKKFMIGIAVGAFALAAAAQEPAAGTSEIRRHVTVEQGSSGGGANWTMAAPATGMIELISPLGGVGGKTVKGAPFSADAETESVQMLVDGNRIVRKSSSKMFRDSEGRTRREQTLEALGEWGSAGDAPTLIFIRDPNTNESYTLNPKDRTAQKAKVITWMAEDGNMHYEASAGAVFFSGDAADKKTQTFEQQVSVITKDRVPHMATAVAAPGGHVLVHTGGPTKTEDLGYQEIEGVKAHGVRNTTTIPAGQIGNDKDINIVAEEWFSDELQMMVMSKHSDPRTGETNYRLTRIDRNEPDKSLFAVPVDYTVVEPKAGNAVFLRKRGEPAAKN